MECTVITLNWLRINQAQPLKFSKSLIWSRKIDLHKSRALGDHVLYQNTCEGRDVEIGRCDSVRSDWRIGIKYWSSEELLVHVRLSVDECGQIRLPVMIKSTSGAT